MTHDRPRNVFAKWAVHPNLGPTLALLALLLLGFGLRLYRLSDQRIWWDEGHAVWAAGHSLYKTTSITAHDVHPPLYLWLLHAWQRLAGTSEFSVRYLSLFGGVLTVALTYVLSRRLIGRQPALLATLLLTTARFHIWWSQEARMYIWATLFGVLSIYALTRLRQGGSQAWWLYILSSTACLYTLYLTVLILLVENLIIAVTIWRTPRRKRFVLFWGLAQISIAILYAPWLYLALPRIRTDIAKTPFTFSQVWQLYGTVLTTGISTDLDRYLWLILVFGLIAVAGIVLYFLDRSQPHRYGFSSRQVGILLALPLLMPPLVVYGLSVPRGFFYSPKPEARYLLLFAPVFYILLAGTITKLWKKGRVGKIFSVLTTLVVLGTFVSMLPSYYAGRYLKDDYQTAMRTLDALSSSQDAVLVVSGDRYPVFLYHYNRQFPDGDGPEMYLMPRKNTYFTAENVDDELAPLYAQYDRVWLASFERTLQDPNNFVEPWFQARAGECSSYVVQGYNSLCLYTKDAQLPSVNPDYRPKHLVKSMLGTAEFIGYDLPTSEFRPGDTVQPAFYLRASEPVTVTLAWLDSQDRVVEQQVWHTTPTNTDADVQRTMTHWAVYGSTAPGSYRFRVCLDDGTQCITMPGGRVTLSQAPSMPPSQPQAGTRTELGEDAIVFLGYRTQPRIKQGTSIRAGESLRVDLYWQAQQPIEKNYTVFAHLIGPYNPATGGPLWAQDDGYPLADGHPTSRWFPGEAITDRRQFDIPENTPPGVYQIEIGFYDAQTGERLTVEGDPANRILLENIEIGEAK